MSGFSSENVLLSTLQPHTLSTTYALPSDNQLGNGTAEVTRTRRVQEQIKMKLAEKSTLPRQNGGTSHYAMSDYGGSSTMKYSTHTPSFSSKSSYMHYKTMDPRMYSKAEFSSRSAAPAMGQFQRMSVGVGGGGGGGGGGFYREEMHTGGFQGSTRYGQMDQDAMSVHSMRTAPAVNSWVMDNSDAGSMVSDRDGTFSRQYTRSVTNGYGAQMRHGGDSMVYQTEVQAPGLSSMRRSLSGTLARGNMMGGGGTEMIQQQQSFKGPASRTIARITNRNRMSMGGLSGTQMTRSSASFGGGGDTVDRGFMMSTLGSGSQGNLFQGQGSMKRSMSIRSMQSVGGGMDIYGQGDLEDMPQLRGLVDMDLSSALSYIKEDDPGLQVMGAAYIQHLCYNENDAKNELRKEGAIPYLVKLIDSNNKEVRRFATGAIRNLIYQNMENKKVFVEANGLKGLSTALDNTDEELCKNITGILWNLSAREGLKERLAKETLPTLSKNILIPISQEKVKAAKAFIDGDDGETASPSQGEIFSNATGCLRNLSSGSVKTRENMRKTEGLVDALVEYINAAFDQKKVEEKDVENCVCVLRNLSYQIYKEMPPTEAYILNNPVPKQSGGSVVGCFAPRNLAAKKKTANQKNMIISHIGKKPKGIQWLWHPNVVALYHKLMKSCEINSNTREAAIGALQNITSGDNWLSEALCSYFDDNKGVPSLLDLLQTEREKELCSITGLMRNLSSHIDMSSALPPLIEKLPEDAHDTSLSSDAVVNMCGVLNNMVIRSFDNAKTLTEKGGINKLMKIKKSALDDFKEGPRAKVRAAATVLANMKNYKKLHKEFIKAGFQLADFAPIPE